jgi:DtxR family Mn-dependent transcriptional regulator
VRDGADGRCRARRRYDARVNPDELSAVAQDYLKVIWSRTEWGAPPITTGELAQRFGTSAANVTETLKRLDAQGLVARTPYKPVELTEAGARCAIAMVRRHRLLETYLVEALGYQWDEVHDEAERLEHAVSDVFVSRIDVHLGHPTADPHGDPIPDADHRWAHPEDARRLISVQESGRFLVLVVSDADPEVLRTARELGLTPGVEVDVEAQPGTRSLVRVLGRDGVEIPGSLAEGLLVRPVA